MMPFSGCLDWRPVHEGSSWQSCKKCTWLVAEPEQWIARAGSDFDDGSGGLSDLGLKLLALVKISTCCWHHLLVLADDWPPDVKMFCHYQLIQSCLKTADCLVLLLLHQMWHFLQVVGRRMRSPEVNEIYSPHFVSTHFTNRHDLFQNSCWDRTVAAFQACLKCLAFLSHAP